MKVLFIARRFPPSVGGMERFAFDLSTSLSNKVDLHKITWGGSNKWLPIILPYFFFRAISVMISNRDIGIIHMQDAVLAPIGWALHVLFRKPYIVVAHGLDITYESKFYQKTILPFVRRADAVISISTATKMEVDKIGVDSSKSYVVTLGTRDDYGKIKRDKPGLAKLLGLDVKSKTVLITTGRLVKRKGVEWFIRNSLSQLVQSNPELLYVVVGEGDERQSIELAIDESGLNKNVIMLGKVSDESRAILYQSCDIFVMPNIVVPGDMEGFGIVAHEAATAQLPVIASNLEGIADALKNDKNGFLIETGNSQGFTDTITLLINDKKLRDRFGRAARKYTLANFSWSKIADQYADVYRNCIR